MANYIYNGQLLSRTAISEVNRGNLDIFQFGNLILNDNVLFNEPYWRSASAGTTYLDTQPYLHIREGQVVGSNTEYNDLGKFLIKDISLGGFEKNTITLNCIDAVSTLASRKRPLPQIFKQRYSYYNDFKDPNSMKDFSFIAEGLWGITNGELMFGTTLYFGSAFIDHWAPSFTAALDKTDTLEDFIISTKVKFNLDLLGDAAGVAMYHRMHDTYSADENPPDISAVSYVSSNYPSGPSYANINGITVAVAPDTWVYLTSTVKQRRRVNYYGFDEETMAFTNYARELLSFIPSFRGRVGIGSYKDESTHWAKYDFFGVEEIASSYSRGQLLNEIVSGDDLYISIPAQNIGLSDFYGLSINGMTYNLGTTNGGLQLNMGSSLMEEFKGRYQTLGATFEDFVVNFNFKWSGVSGPANLGIGFGNTTNYIGLLIGKSTCSEIYGYEKDVVPFKNRGNLLTLENDIWYKGKVVKEDTKLNVFINDTFTGYAGGQSLSILTSPGSFMFLTGGLGMLNYKLSIRDLKFESLINTYNTIQNEMGGMVGKDLDRLFPYGYRLNVLGRSLELIQLGQSVATFSSGDMIRTAHTNNLNRYMKFLYTKGNNVAVTYSNPSDKISLNGLLSDNAKTIDNSITVKSALEDYGQYDLRREMSDSDIYNLVTLHRPNWNVLDNVACYDHVLGMSGNYYIDTLLKRYSANIEYLQYTTVKRNVI
jgi:hypothetical protein